MALLILQSISSTVFAQDKTVKDLKSKAMTEKKLPALDSGKNWTTGGAYLLNIGQGSLSNWAAGGEEFSFSMNTYWGFHARYKKGRITWDNFIDLSYGFMNTTSQGTRKIDDRLDLTSKYGYGLSKKVSLATLMNFRTQFSKGYNYLPDGSKELLSNFMSPGYFLLSLGIDYKPVKGLSIFVSPLTSRWTFVSDDALSSLGYYGVEAGEHVRNEIGAFASIGYLKEFNKRITLNSRLDLFSNYKSNPQNIDVMMTNMLTAKISKIFSFNVGFDLIYDDDIKLFGKNNNSPALQIKQTFGAGLALTF